MIPVFLIIWVIVFTVIFGAVFKNNSSSAWGGKQSGARVSPRVGHMPNRVRADEDRQKSVSREPQPVQKPRSGQKNKSINKNLQSGSERLKLRSESHSTLMADDRANDWLARQLREEDRIYRRGSGLDLGAAHQVSCEADDIKKSHVKVHGKE